MKLMIDIPEEDYIRLRDEGMFGNVTTFKRAVREGIPLEQAPCEDCISRQAAIDACLNGWNKDYKEIVKEIRALPSATPQYTDAEIQKMQDLEFAEIQKAYEIGKEEGSSEKPNKWIPVSERYPKDGQRILVDYCDEDAGIMLIRFNVNGYHGFKAWMPLPLPYKAESEVDE